MASMANGAKRAVRDNVREDSRDVFASVAAAVKQMLPRRASGGFGEANPRPHGGWLAGSSGRSIVVAERRNRSWVRQRRPGR